MKGNLIIRPLSAKLKRDTDFLSRMDPYVKLKLGGQVRQTSVAHGAGKTPAWSDQISFYYNNEDLLEIEVWDYDLTSRNDLVGSGAMAISTIQKRGNKVCDWVQLTYKGRNAGTILLDIQFVPDHNYGGYGQNVMPTTYGVAQPGMPQTFPMTPTTYQVPVQQVYTQPVQTYQQPIYQQPIPQQVYPQQQYQTIPQQIYPQQQQVYTQPIPQQQVYTQPIPQQLPGQFIPNPYGQQGTYQQPGGFIQQQGYPQGKFYC